jgi:hypothetical protein
LTQKRSRKPTKLDDLREYIIDKLKECPLSASRIYREIQDRGFTGKYTIVKDFVHEVRPKIGVPAIYDTRPNQEFKLRLIGPNAVISISVETKGNSTVSPWFLVIRE